MHRQSRIHSPPPRSHRPPRQGATLWFRRAGRGTAVLACMGVLLGHLACGAHDVLAADAIDFNRDIRPILSDKCYRCHGPAASSREADLRLDREDSAKMDRGGYAAIVPGKPDDSELVKRITNKDESERMPPADSGKTLSPEEIALLSRWIKEGASWSLPWAYIAPKRHAIPTVKDAAWPANWVDQFILARLDREGLQPSPDADKTTLVRRLYIDLTGLPPKPAEVDAFLADKSPDAFGCLVDRLLASPHYGERMAAYWLDLVRYADTVGYHGDQEHHIAPYRDYVIQSFNANLPFDRFTRQQLAGDLLPDPTLAQKIATGYNRVLQTSHEGGVQAKEYLAIYAADRIRNLSVVWMGATMGCAQCHDHKYDPYTMRDFYSMQAFFADIDEAQHLKKGFDKSPTLRAPEMELLTAEETTRLADLEGQLKDLKKQLAAAKASANVADHSTDAAATEPKADRSASGSSPKADAPPAKKSDTDTKPDGAAKPKKDAGEDDGLKKQIGDVEAKIKSLHDNALWTMITVSIKPRTIRVLPRGNWLDDSGPVVQPAVPEFLGKIDTGQQRPTRLDLANWLTDSKGGVGGLTARVMVNRFWYLLFGAGLTRSLDDFGGQGEAPSHPELLDNLAVELVDSGWDVKHVVRLLVTSRAYRQASAETPLLHQRDPLNRLVARQTSFRYPAEAVRDSALAISGLLVDAQGGPSARPYQPAGYYRHLNFPEREYQPSTDKGQWRRGVYVHWQRQFLHPMLKAFDAPSREECTVARPRSNTALAALVLLNDPSFVEASRAFAARILREGGKATDERLAFAFRQAVSRPPEDNETRLLGELLTKSHKYYSEAPQDAEKLLAVGLTSLPEGLDQTELAAWSIVARSILNMSETITRN